MSLETENKEQLKEKIESGEEEDDEVKDAQPGADGTAAAKKKKKKKKKPAAASETPADLNAGVEKLNVKEGEENGEDEEGDDGDEANGGETTEAKKKRKRRSQRKSQVVNKHKPVPKVQLKNKLIHLVYQFANSIRMVIIQRVKFANTQNHVIAWIML